MKPIVVVRNEPEVPPGFLGDALDRRGVDWYMVRADEGEALPESGTLSGAVVLGGAMGAYDDAAFPFLGDEKRFIAASVGQGLPVLGLCLGAQLLADALGGRAYLAESAEVVFAPVDLSGEGRADPVAAAMADRDVVRFHRDTFIVPPDATLLASGGGYPQVFRLRSALGIQPHPEVTSGALEDWLAGGEARQMAIDSGTDPEAICAAFRLAQPAVEETAALVFDRWIDEVVATLPQPRTQGS